MIMLSDTATWSEERWQFLPLTAQRPSSCDRSGNSKKLPLDDVTLPLKLTN